VIVDPILHFVQNGDRSVHLEVCEGALKGMDIPVDIGQTLMKNIGSEKLLEIEDRLKKVFSIDQDLDDHLENIALFFDLRFQNPLLRNIAQNHHHLLLVGRDFDGFENPVFHTYDAVSDDNFFWQ